MRHHGIRLTTSNSEPANRAKALNPFRPKVSMVSSVKGTGNRPPTAKETMENRRSENE